MGPFFQFFVARSIQNDTLSGAMTPVPYHLVPVSSQLSATSGVSVKRIRSVPHGNPRTEVRSAVVHLHFNPLTSNDYIRQTVVHFAPYFIWVFGASWSPLRNPISVMRTLATWLLRPAEQTLVAQVTNDCCAGPSGNLRRLPCFSSRRRTSP